MVRKCITDEQIGRLHRRADDMIRRAIEGTISFDLTMEALQAIIEGKHEPAKEPDAPSLKVCQVFNGNRCTICGGFFADGAGETVCANGHEIGVASYP